MKLYRNKKRRKETLMKKEEVWIDENNIFFLVNKFDLNPSINVFEEKMKQRKILITRTWTFE